MNRREFLVGLAATTVATAALPVLPTTATTNAELWFKQWALDMQPIIQQVFENTVIFGIGGHQQTNVYPYLKSIHPTEISHQA